MPEEKKPWYKTVLDFIWNFVKEIPSWLLAIARTPTGKRILATLIVSALAAIGVEAPFEMVRDILNEIFKAAGADMALTTGQVMLTTLIGILFDGTLRANDTAKDLKKAKSGVLASIKVVEGYPMGLALVKTANDVVVAKAFEWHRTTGFTVITKDGEKIPMRRADLRYDMQKDIYDRLKDEANV